MALPTGAVNIFSHFFIIQYELVREKHSIKRSYQFLKIHILSSP
ncbi:hypothetical protein LEP1GSC053_0886 [Leptospira interrogans serovar Muenchen str. Brem 129]|nr:hypothetical protein LEP1GSC087_1900 [Leptospira interrogans serovar Bataviae str. L1111]EMN09326.1 hypothetical protein LEP1GSC053_0886 [Leptospira interrogans serovar Muenchen str. Brem 129]